MWHVWLRRRGRWHVERVVVWRVLCHRPDMTCTVITFFLAAVPWVVVWRYMQIVLCTSLLPRVKNPSKSPCGNDSPTLFVRSLGFRRAGLRHIYVAEFRSCRRRKCFLRWEIRGRHPWLDWMSLRCWCLKNKWNIVISSKYWSLRWMGEYWARGLKVIKLT